MKPLATPEASDPTRVSLTTEDVFRAVDRKRDRITTLLCDLIRIPTIVPPGNNYEDMVNYLEPVFQKLGFHTERVVIPEEQIEKIPYPLEGPRTNLVATRNHDKEEAVTIYAHMDVVPIEEPWTKDPFGGVVENDHIYGRGAFDMKSGIAAMIVALEVMDELGLPPHFNIVCTLCTDEELGVYPGIYHLAKEGYVKGHLLNTEFGSQMPIISPGLAGSLEVTVRTKGRSCHSGMNYIGVNAVEAMVPILTELLQLKAEVEQRESAVPIVPFLRSMGAPSDKLTPMFNIDIIRGGTKSNIVPAECELVINRRYIPEEAYSDVVQEIQDAVDRGHAKSKALDVEVSVVDSYRPFKADPESRYSLKMREALKAVHGYQDSDFVVGSAAGSTDMGFVAQALKTDKFIGVGAATLGNMSAHKPDEWVSVDTLTKMAKQLVHYLAL
ncbi:MAG: M20 family metallopeptidase [Promethearchaeota archaeon]